jgi:hypothetical protein
MTCRARPLVVDLGIRGDLAGQHDEARVDERLGGDAAVLVLR